MYKINKKYFLTYLQPIIEKGIVTTIKKEKVKEYKLGKHYFYEITDEKIRYIHEWLNKSFQKNIDLNNSSIAYRKGYSYLNLFEPHRHNYYFLRLDIKSFFHSIQMSDIIAVFEPYFDNEHIDEKKKQKLIDGFINLVTFKIPVSFKNKEFKSSRILPIGFITSPVISNIIFRKIDLLIQKFCSEKNIIYTRYSDDMLFSSSNNSKYLHSEDFYKEISIFLNIMNFKLNQNKTLYATHTLSLNGYTLQYSNQPNSKNEQLINEFRLSNKKLLIIKKMIYLINKQEKSPKFILNKLFNFGINKLSTKYPIESKNVKEKYYYDQLLNKLTGYRSYVLSIVVFDKKHDCCQDKTIDKYTDIVEDLNKIIKRYIKKIETISKKIEDEIKESESAK